MKPNDLSADQITDVVLALVGDTDAYGESHIDKTSLENQKVLTDVIDTLIWEVIKNTKYADRTEYSIRLIGQHARRFLGNMIEEYDLNEYAEEE